MNAPAPIAADKILLDAEGLRRTLSRIAHEIIEANPDLTRVALVGIQTRGVPLAHRLRRLIAEFSLAQQDVADAVGRDRSTVANALRLLKLPVAVLQMLHEGQLSVGHARALLALEDPKVATNLAREAVAQGLSVREVEDRVRGGRAPERRPRMKRGVGPAPEVRRVEDALRRRLGTDVRVSLRAKGKGQIQVAFYSNDDLARVLELMLGAPFDG